MKNPLAFLIGRGLKAMAADEGVSPEDLAEAARAAHRATDSEEDPEEKKKKEAEDAKRMRDAAEEEERKKKEGEDSVARAADKKRADDAEAEVEKLKKESEDRKAKDAEAEGKEQHFMPCKVKDCAARDCRMHGALDGVLKSQTCRNSASCSRISWPRKPRNPSTKAKARNLAMPPK
jgi:hypothetical protein